MSLVTTPALVLQTYRYSETSKVVRLATRDLGVHSAIAKGALRPKSRFGAGLELLSEGVAQLYFRETRELHTLGAFDLVNLRRDLAGDVGRFAGAAALAEVMLKMAPPAPLPVAYDTLTAALDALEAAPPDRVDASGVRAMWRLVSCWASSRRSRHACETTRRSSPWATPPCCSAWPTGACSAPAARRLLPSRPAGCRLRRTATCWP